MKTIVDVLVVEIETEIEMEIVTGVVILAMMEAARKKAI